MRLLKINLSFLLALALIFSSCNANRTTKGGAIGAGSGAVIGGVIGKAAGNTAAGAIIGAAVGGIAGAAIGRHMDKQAEELQRDLENARIERVGEGIKITFDSGILFATNKYDLQSSAMSDLNDLSTTLKKYEDTNIIVEGHTDNVGADDYNMGLSERRANSVSSYLKSRGVSGTRISTIGHGESMPVADNSTEAGRQQNRRVEIAIFANEKMKKAAERGEL